MLQKQIFLPSNSIALYLFKAYTVYKKYRQLSKHVNVFLTFVLTSFIFTLYLQASGVFWHIIPVTNCEYWTAETIFRKMIQHNENTGAKTSSLVFWCENTISIMQLSFRHSN